MSFYDFKINTPAGKELKMEDITMMTILKHMRPFYCIAALLMILGCSSESPEASTNGIGGGTPGNNAPTAATDSFMADQGGDDVDTTGPGIMENDTLCTLYVAVADHG